jgi:acetyl-CoA acetyltransferase
MKAEDISLWEINEAFSVVVPASSQILGVSQDKINGEPSFYLLSARYH